MDVQIWHWDIPTSSGQTNNFQENILKPTFPGFKEKSNSGKRVIPLSAAPPSNLGAISEKQTGGARRMIEAATKNRLGKPQLLGLLHSLPSNVTTISACMAAVATSSDTGSPANSHLTGLIAAATVGGSIEVVSLACGSLMPLAAQVSISLGEARTLDFQNARSVHQDGHNSGNFSSLDKGKVIVFASVCHILEGLHSTLQETGSYSNWNSCLRFMTTKLYHSFPRF